MAAVMLLESVFVQGVNGHENRNRKTMDETRSVTE